MLISVELPYLYNFSSDEGACYIYIHVLGFL